MKHVPEQTHSSGLIHEISHPVDLIQFTDELNYLDLLLPEIANNHTRNLRTYALAYIERYPDDVLQLEHEWKLLYAALRQSSQRADYATVIALVQSLAHIVGRLDNPTVAEHILRQGIDACQQLPDHKHLAIFQNRLATLLFSHGNYQEGRHLWYSSLGQAASCGDAVCVWEPLSSFAHMADILGDHEGIQQFIDTLQRIREHESSDYFLTAIFIRGFCARVANNPTEAQNDLKYCLRLLSTYRKNAYSPFYHQLFTMAVQTELARVQGNYARSQAYAESSHSLAQLVGDRYTAASLLIDQMFFTYQQERFADAQTAFLRLCTLSYQYADPSFIRYCRILEQRFALQSPQRSGYTQHTQRAIPATSSSLFQEALSEREVEVLQCIADGYSNQEIATLLVITTGTVKKHLEHIYAKLHVRSRTSAIAKARSLGILA